MEAAPASAGVADAGAAPLSPLSRHASAPNSAQAGRTLRLDLGCVGCGRWRAARDRLHHMWLKSEVRLTEETRRRVTAEDELAQARADRARLREHERGRKVAEARLEEETRRREAAEATLARVRGEEGVPPALRWIRGEARGDTRPADPDAGAMLSRLRADLAHSRGETAALRTQLQTALSQLSSLREEAEILASTGAFGLRPPEGSPSPSRRGGGANGGGGESGARAPTSSSAKKRRRKKKPAATTPMVTTTPLARCVTPSAPPDRSPN